MVESWVFFYIEDGWNYLMESGYGNSFSSLMVFVLRGFFSSFPSSILFPLSSGFFRGELFQGHATHHFSSLSSLSLANDTGAPWYSHCACLSEIFILRFLAFAVTLWIPYGRVGYEKFRKNGITTSIIHSRCASVTGPNQGFDDKV
ncbi:hypothetical protein B9Z19DRAFT_415225 [Tuber borchii]|uniref:Uncharacterized protein n=1 Tax=Tuber borchii TaxID=42251 RepID=A0A2T7A3W5_TUBBO|nr:hypothetical protein B9Z19DRAFT_415225 [Tuber borchii]